MNNKEVFVTITDEKGTPQTPVHIDYDVFGNNGMLIVNSCAPLYLDNRYYVIDDHLKTGVLYIKWNIQEKESDSIQHLLQRPGGGVFERSLLKYRKYTALFEYTKKDGTVMQRRETTYFQNPSEILDQVAFWLRIFSDYNLVKLESSEEKDYPYECSTVTGLSEGVPKFQISLGRSRYDIAKADEGSN